MKYVVLTADIHPYYSTYAPLQVRLWRRLGFEPLLILQEDGWDSPLGCLVLQELDCTIYRVPTIPPLSAGNTMRVARVAAASVAADLPDDALLMATDIDLIPISRTFFDRSWSLFVLRADRYVNLCTLPRLTPETYLMPMFYTCLTARAWRQAMDLNGSFSESMRRLVDEAIDLFSADYTQDYWDERILTKRILGASFAQGDLVHVEGGLWRQGELYLLGGLTSWGAEDDGWPLGMQGAGGDGPRGLDGTAIDFISWRAPLNVEGAVNFVLKHWPEEGVWLNSYVSALHRVL